MASDNWLHCVKNEITVHNIYELRSSGNYCAAHMQAKDIFALCNKGNGAVV